MEFDKNKTKYFVIAIILLIILGVILILHFNNKKMVGVDEDTKKTTKKVDKKKDDGKKLDLVTESEGKKEIYKSVVDSETKILYNYKLTDEISDEDIIISKKVAISDTLKSNNVIGLFDISLYDSNMIKKSVNNSLITISIPITGELVGYDTYKVVYIDNDNNITNEEFNTTVADGYITFDTTHLSLYGIIGTKSNLVQLSNEVNLNNVTVSVLNNNEVIDPSETLYFTPNNKLTLTTEGIDNCELYYGFRKDNTNDFTYYKYIDEVNFDGIDPYEVVTLVVKVVYGDDFKTEDLNTIKLYDIIYNYDRKNPDDSIQNGSPEEIMDRSILIEDVTDNESELEDAAAVISVLGNSYVVDEADLSKLYMEGSLTIDTDKNITLSETEMNKIELKGLTRITIVSKSFTLNQHQYTYVVKNGVITISKVEEEETTPITNDVFKEIFDNSEDLFVTTDEDENLVVEQVIYS